jgi:hypothetical protein
MAVAHRFVSIHAGDLLIALHDKDQPTDSQWAALMDNLKTVISKHGGDFSRIYGMVITDGGAPSHSQRELLNNVLSGKSWKISVLSDSLMVRGVVTALNWFNPEIRAFPSSEVQAFMSHLPVQRSEYPLVRRETRLLQNDIRVNTLTAAEYWFRAT